MRASGIILTVLCAIMSVTILWLGYTCTFEDHHLLRLFEGTPREGWDYWIQKEYWENLWAYMLWVVIAIGCTLIPALGVWRSRSEISARRRIDWILFFLSVPNTFIWLSCTISWLRGAEESLILFAPFIILLGSLYGGVVFWQRARHRL